LHAAAKAEGWGVYQWPYSGRVEQLGVDNLWTVWPTFLTLAPVLSNRICDAIRKGPLSGGSRHSSPRPFWTLPARSEEYWKTAWKNGPLLPWPEFCASIGFKDGGDSDGDDVLGS
jgi:hypothetical protein